MRNKLVSIIIPSFNGKELLETFLPTVIEASEYYGDCEVIVVDDGSTDESVGYLKARHPKVKIIGFEKNTGYGNAVNTGVENCRGEIVILLNNDVKVDKNFVSPLVKYFEDNLVFSVVAKSLLPDKDMANESITRLEFKNGNMELLVPGVADSSVNYEEPCTVSHACGGFSAFAKGKFIQLGGLDDLYFPFYWEDADICYRAWKRGWWVLYEPQSIVYHHRHGTIRKMIDSTYVDRIYIRNHLLFTWKNITDEEILIEHFRWLNSYIKDAHEPFKTGFYEALKKMMVVLKKRKEQCSDFLFKDRDVLILSSNLRYPDEALNMRKKIEKQSVYMRKEDTQ